MQIEISKQEAIILSRLLYNAFLHEIHAYKFAWSEKDKKAFRLKDIQRYLNLLLLLHPNEDQLMKLVMDNLLNSGLTLKRNRIIYE